MSEIESRIRTRKLVVEENSATVERIVESLVLKYSRDLDDYIRNIKKMLERRDNMSDDEIENAVLKVPVFLYFASSGLESLGIEGDNALAVKKQAFNDIYIETEGTIQDKTKTAELATFPEYLLEVAYNRAYKRLKTQIEMAEHVFSGLKKVLSKRMMEFDVAKMDTASLQYNNKQRRDRYE
jgi:hypothetical protein